MLRCLLQRKSHISFLFIMSRAHVDHIGILDPCEITLITGGDDHLSAGKLGEDVIFAFSVKLGEHVIEKKNGIFTAFLLGDLPLSKLHGERDASLLTLGGKDLGVHAAEPDLKIIAMRTADRRSDDHLAGEMITHELFIFLKVDLIIKKRIIFTRGDV